MLGLELSAVVIVSQMHLQSPLTDTNLVLISPLQFGRHFYIC
jgi:hypothetical protein